MFYFLRWLTYVAEFINGLIATITFGFYDPNISLFAERYFADWCSDQPTKVKKCGRFDTDRLIFVFVALAYAVIYAVIIILSLFVLLARNN